MGNWSRTEKGRQRELGGYGSCPSKRQLQSEEKGRTEWKNVHMGGGVVKADSKGSGLGFQEKVPLPG